MTAHTKDPQVTEAKLDLKDPLQRNAEQLLESAYQSRADNQLYQSITLGYMALLKTGEKNSDTDLALKARIHLFLSEAMGEFRDRATERIHAKEAYRELYRIRSPASRLNPGPFLFRLGVVMAKSGEYAIAELYYRRALQAFEANASQYSKSISLTLLELTKLKLKQIDIHRRIEDEDVAQLNTLQGDMDRALDLASENNDFETLMSVMELQAKILLRFSSQLPAEHSAFESQLLAQAEKILQDSLEKRFSFPESDIQTILEVMNDLIATLRRSEQIAAAKTIAGQVLDIMDGLQRIDPEIALNMALVAKYEGADKRLLSLCNVVMNTEEAQITKFSSNSSEALALAFSARAGYQSMKCLAMLGAVTKGKDIYARGLLDLALRRKAIIADAQSAFWETLHAQSDSDLSNARGQLIALRNQLSTKVVAGDATGYWQIIQNIEHMVELLSVEPVWRNYQKESTPKEQKSLQGYAQSVLEGVQPWDALIAQQPDLEEKTDEPVPSITEVALQAIGKRLPENTVFVAFVKIDDFDFERDLLLNTAHYWALVLRTDGQTAAIDLGEAHHLETGIMANLQPLHSGDRLDKEAQQLAAGKLYGLIWAPIADEIKKIQNIVISPDAVLALVPFAALLAPDQRFLVERHTLYQISSGRDLMERVKPTMTPGPAVVIADPDFDAGSAAPREPFEKKRLKIGVEQNLARLDETLKEGNEIRAILGGNTKLITRGQASESQISALHNPEVLHLATHGVFLKNHDKPEQQLSEVDAVAANSSYINYVATLSRSGLALSGINRGGAEPGQDGLLTAFDVAGMDLTGTRLVVMSACDTGLGDVLAGEGVLGLRRSFRVAGARFVVMSLWRLSDKEARRQMRAFYKDYNSGENPVSALHRVQRARIKRLRQVLGYAPPALWGALTIEGID